MRKVIFLHNKFPGNKPELVNLLSRWNKYGEAIHKYSGNEVLWLFTLSSQRGEIQEEKYLKFFDSVESRKHNLGRILALTREIRKSASNFTLVCGDTQKSLMIGIYLRLMLGSKVRIQTQFHGDIYSFRFNQGLKGTLRALFSRLGIIASYSIRIVSKFQMDEIVAFAPKSKNKFVLAPIPIDNSRIAIPHKSKNTDLAFIGRLHQERGISELIRIIEMVKKALPESKVVIAGDGHLRKKIQKELSRWIEQGDVKLLGYLNPEQILNVYADTKILISTAPREGYGLTLREAALSQVLVVAQFSKGASEAQESYPLQIKTFSTLAEAVALIENSLNQKIYSAMPNQIDAQMQIDSQGVTRLIHSWVEN
jgi:glycosyltransferase involved in cell wall biosynthesis